MQELKVKIDGSLEDNANLMGARYCVEELESGYYTVATLRSQEDKLRLLRATLTAPHIDRELAVFALLAFIDDTDVWNAYRKVIGGKHG